MGVAYTDRLHLRCTACGKTAVLMDYNPFASHATRATGKLHIFLEKHIKCSQMGRYHDLEGDGCFTVVAESNEQSDQLIDSDEP